MDFTRNVLRLLHEKKSLQRPNFVLFPPFWNDSANIIYEI